MHYSIYSKLYLTHCYSTGTQLGYSVARISFKKTYSWFFFIYIFVFFGKPVSIFTHFLFSASIFMNSPLSELSVEIVNICKLLGILNVIVFLPVDF